MYTNQRAQHVSTDININQFCFYADKIIQLKDSTSFYLSRLCRLHCTMHVRAHIALEIWKYREAGIKEETEHRKPHFQHLRFCMAVSVQSARVCRWFRHKNSSLVHFLSKMNKLCILFDLNWISKWTCCTG